MIIFFYFDLYKLLPEFSIKKVVHQPVQSPLRQLPPLGGAAEHCFTKVERMKILHLSSLAPRTILYLST